MRVTERRASPWRHPALAPGYAAVIAFGAVALSSLVVTPQERGTGTPEQVTVTVSAADARLLAGLTVQVRDSATVLAEGRTDAQGRWSAVVTSGEHEVCVITSAAPLRLVGSHPASACRRERISTGTAIKLAVEQVQVVAETTNKPDRIPNDSTVTVRYAERVLQSGVLGLTGRFTPSELPLNAEVCLGLPTGWRFADSETTGQQCQPVTNPAADVRFRLEAS
ncbi:hypothetical protein [Frankia sp. Cppng1_Ct_nod]|uniref:hypothetical protein n=1 Tax=Frankia sp. Cppng1_Ct_nod TaxID=2897162 RepID=UPI001041430A|nr:hypothetical protein [Frankia sp. Cppng1_Ct_nod]